MKYSLPVHFISRLCLLICGLTLLAFGVVLSIHSNLGTSPISSVPYTFSFISGMSVGLLTVIMHIIMIVLQMVLLGRKFQWHQWLQLPVGMIFGLLIDTLMWTTQSWSIEYYGWQMLACLSSCLITALGVCLIIKASLVFLAGEGLYLAVSQRFNINFGSCKTYGDIVLVAFAVISGWLALGYSAGVREGTVITALLVGTLVKKILPKLNFIQLTKA